MQEIAMTYNTENYTIVSVYLIYLALSLALTYFVGRTLNRNGRLFLVKVFNDNEAIADSLNHLLLVGFYLVNLGFVTLALKYGQRPTDIVTAIEALSTKIGMAVIVLGGMHFFNMRCLMTARYYNLFPAAPEATNV